MIQRAKEYLDSPNYLTLKKAAEEAGLDPLTFKKYAANIGVNGTPISKYTFYSRDDVNKIRNIVEGQVPVWIRMIERATGKKVKLI